MIASGHNTGQCRGQLFFGLMVVALLASAALGRTPAAGAPALAAEETVIYLPLVIVGPRVNLQSRSSVLSFYRQEYLTSVGVPIAWSGDHANCDPGGAAAVFQEAVLRRVNYFRYMAGVPTTTFHSLYNQKAQAAALLISVNGEANHAPPGDWLCYGADGAEGAGHSSLNLGDYGPAAIDGYVKDYTAANYFVAHRRYLLYPQTQAMGTGDVPAAAGYFSANALWAFDEHYHDPRPGTRHEYVAWPAPGYAPYPVVYPRWSFSYPGADFSAATVSMASNGSPISLAQEAVLDGYADNTLVWIPLGLDDTEDWPRPSADTPYTITIDNVLIDSQARSFAYEVIVFDPEAP